MPKNKNAPPPALLSPSSQESVDGSQKKKKKRKKSEKEEDNNVFSPSSVSLSELSSPSSSPSKKKKKEINWNGMIEEEEVQEKKKKKKEKKQQQQQQQLQQQQEEEEEVVVKKKKKKKKEEKRMEEEVQEESPKKKKRKSIPTTTITTSPSKKLKREVEEEEEEEEEEWPEETTVELFNQVMSQLPNHDQLSCRRRVLKLDWEAAALPGKSSDVCQAHFMNYFNKISHFKILSQVITEMQAMASSGLKDRRNRPSLPLTRFLRGFFTPELKAKAKRSGKNLLRLGHEAWKRLPAEDKEMYMQAYKEDCLKIEASLSPLNKPLKLPYQLCWENEKESATNKTSRGHFTSLTPERQFPYIKQALEAFYRFEKAVESSLATNPDFQPPSHQNMSKGDLNTYLEVLGCPPLPAHSASMVYYLDLQEHGSLKEVPGTKKMVEVMRQFRSLSEAQKNEYKTRCEAGKAEFEEELKKWSQGQSELTLYALQKYKELVRTPTTMTKRPRHTTPVFEHKEVADTPCPRFIAEPAKPPGNAYYLYAAKFKQSVTNLSGAELRAALSESWNGLSAKYKDIYNEKSREFLLKYERELKEYVQKLDAKTRRLYLGFNRLPLYRFFGNRDIFDEFPNSEAYPVFVKPEKTKDSRREKDEVEEVAVSSRHNKKKLSPVLFSDLSSPPSGSNQKGSSKLQHLEESEDSDDDFKDMQEFVLPVKQAKKKSTTAATTKKVASPKKKAPAAGKKKAVAPTNDSDDEEEVTPAWRADPPTPVTPVQTKKKASTTTPSKATKKKALPPPTHDSDDPKDTRPAWDYGLPTPIIPSQAEKKITTTTPTTTPKASKKKAPPPPPPHDDSDEEEEEEEEEVVRPAWDVGLPTPTLPMQAKKKATTTTPVSAKATKKKALPPPPSQDSEDSDDDEEEDIAPAWRSGPPTPISPTKSKKKAATSPTKAAKKKAPPPPPPQDSEDSDDDEEDITPAWRSGPPTPISPSKSKKAKQTPQPKKEESSSSGFSDSESSD